MKTIEERAERYEHWAGQIANRWDKPAELIPFKEQIKRAFIAGAKSQYEELTRWHDPKEELPEKYKDVEIKTDKGKVSVCNMDLDERGRRYWYVSRTDYMIPDANIIGWREIHE